MRQADTMKKQKLIYGTGKSIYLFYYISCDFLLKELYYVGGT